VIPLELDSDRFELRCQQAAEAAEFGAVFADASGETHSYAALAPAAAAGQEQLELLMGKYSERAAIRAALADKIERELPDAPEPWLQKIPERLRLARQSAQWGIRLSDGKLIAYWDNKAGLSRLCPDDAREESMRLRRRVQPTLEALQASGQRITYAVFTMPNSAAGELREGMAAIFKRFKRVVLGGDFPQITGALAVLEAPLGQARDWNVHLNVIFAHRGFVDWGRLRAAWHWNVEFRLLPKSPGAIGAALAELIKYAVAATVAKSAQHADGGRSPAPPMLDWRGLELGEWLRAFHGFRRTRGYGALYGLEEPEAEEQGPIVWLGSVSLQGGRYRVRSSLVDSIPEDKLTGSSRRSVLEALMRTLAPGGIRGAGTIGAYVPAVTLSAKA
jgi:hypothetical protein